MGTGVIMNMDMVESVFFALLLFMISITCFCGWRELVKYNLENGHLSQREILQREQKRQSFSRSITIKTIIGVIDENSHQNMTPEKDHDIEMGQQQYEKQKIPKGGHAQNRSSHLNLDCNERSEDNSGDNTDHIDNDGNNNGIDLSATFLKRIQKDGRTTSRSLTSLIRETDLISCSICLKNYAVGEKIGFSNNPRCTHIFHEGCIIEWLLVKNSCPICRRDYVLNKESETKPCRFRAGGRNSLRQ